MKRLIFVCAALLLLGSCSQGYKMPKGLEQELRAYYTEWHGKGEADWGHLTSEQKQIVWEQDYDIVHRYGLMEQAVELGYFTEPQDTTEVFSQNTEYMQGWIQRNTTAEYQKLVKNAEQLTIDEIMENGKLLPIEKLQLVEFKLFMQ